jgi:hypothetical protein
MTKTNRKKLIYFFFINLAKIMKNNNYSKKYYQEKSDEISNIKSPYWLFFIQHRNTVKGDLTLNEIDKILREKWNNLPDE